MIYPKSILQMLLSVFVTLAIFYALMAMSITTPEESSPDGTFSKREQTIYYAAGKPDGPGTWSRATGKLSEDWANALLDANEHRIRDMIKTAMPTVISNTPGGLAKVTPSEMYKQTLRTHRTDVFFRELLGYLRTERSDFKMTRSDFSEICRKRMAEMAMTAYEEACKESGIEPETPKYRKTDYWNPLDAH